MGVFEEPKREAVRIGAAIDANKGEEAAVCRRPRHSCTATEPFGQAPATLEHFLTERYCLYTVGRSGRVRRVDIHHPPWPLQDAEAEMPVNTMAAAAGIDLPDTPPILHFSKRQDMVGWWGRRVG